MNTEQDYEKEFDQLYSEGKIGEGVLDDDLVDFRDDWIAQRMEDQTCKTCGGTKEITTMERVYPNEPHMAPIGTERCPDCIEEEEYNEER